MSDVINKIKQQIVLSNEIQKYVNLRKRGDLFIACCPFHEEKTPSFTVNDQKNIYYCFGCGIHGDLFSFVSKIENIEFKTILKRYADKFEIKYEPFKKLDKNLTDVLNDVKDFYQVSLENNQEAKDYLIKRKISLETIEKMEIGYSPKFGLVDLLLKKYSKDSIVQAGVCSDQMIFDRMRERIIFPMRNKNNEIIGFIGRVINDNLPKYLNYPETELFSKSLHLFNENNLKLNQPIILVEGCIDAISLMQKGFNNSLALMGTSLSLSQILMMFNITNTIYLMLDNDKAGQKATEKNIESFLKYLQPGKMIFVTDINPYKDPDELCNSNNDINLILKNAIPLFDWLYQKYQLETQNNPDILSENFRLLEALIKSIENSYVRKAYDIILKKKTQNFAYNSKKNINFFAKSLSQKIFPLEDKVMQILLNFPTFWATYLEQFMVYKFTNYLYEKVKLKVIEDLILYKKSVETINLEIKEIFGEFLINLLENNNLSHIIPNGSLILLYGQDLLKTMFFGSQEKLLKLPNIPK